MSDFFISKPVLSDYLYKHMHNKIISQNYHTKWILDNALTQIDYCKMIRQYKTQSVLQNDKITQKHKLWSATWLSNNTQIYTKIHMTNLIV